MKKNKVVITGLGVITSNGTNKTEFFEHSIRGQSGIDDSVCPLFDVSKLKTGFFGKIKDSNIETYVEQTSQKQIDRCRRIAKAAAREAMNDAGITPHDIENYGNRAALVTASLSYEDYLYDDIFQYNYMQGVINNITNDYLFLGTELKNYCKVRGICYNISAACSSGTAAIGEALDLIRYGSCDIVLVCGIDVLSEMVAYGFHSLQALSNGLCKPLDAKRDGINIGEGCGFLILESEKNAVSRNCNIYAECVEYSLGNEAFHITSPDTSTDGFYYSMKNALERAKLSPDDIDYINLHGTGTQINDNIELRAISRLYEGTNIRPYVSSLKTLIGHCMGAAGTLEAIMTILCIHNQRYLPIHRISEETEELQDFSLVPPTKKIQYAMSNSFAFAGNTASIIFKKYSPSSMEEIVKNNNVYLNGIGVICSNAPTSAYFEYLLGFRADAPYDITEIDTHNLPAPTNGIPAKKLRGLHHLSKLILSASLQAKNDAFEDTSPDDFDPYMSGTLCSSHYGSVNSRLKYRESVLLKKPDLCNPTLFVNNTPNSSVGYLAINFNYRGFSTNLHGSNPFSLAYDWLKNGNLKSLFCCCGDEYSSSTEYNYNLHTSGKKHDFQERCFSFYLSDKKCNETYCEITNIFSCSISGDPFLDAQNLFQDCNNEKVCDNIYKLLTTDYIQNFTPDYIFVSDHETYIDKKEQEILYKLFPNAATLSSKQLLGFIEYDIFMANIAAAAICIKNQSVPNSLALSNETSADLSIKPSKILITGYDSCGNYHAACIRAVMPH